MIDKVKFYTKFRKHFGRFRNSQLEGLEAILNHFVELGLVDIRFAAYMLATAWHETATTMQPIEEYGKGKGRRYGKKLKHSGVAYTTPNKIYDGRGLVQLTWYENYLLMGRLLGYDLLNHPELAMQMKVAVEIMFEGMMKGSSSFGDFTGKCLEMYFNDKTEDPVSARKIINGNDCANVIAQYYWNFKDCLTA